MSEAIKVGMLLDSFTKDEFIAVAAVVHWLHLNGPTPVHLVKAVSELNKAVEERASIEHTNSDGLL